MSAWLEKWILLSIVVPRNLPQRKWNNDNNDSNNNNNNIVLLSLAAVYVIILQAKHLIRG